MKTTWTNLSRNQFGWVKPVIGGSDCVFLVSVETRFPFSNQKMFTWEACFSLSCQFCFLSCLTVHSWLICMHPWFCVTSHILHLGWNVLMHWQRWVLLVLYLLFCLFMEHRHILPQKNNKPIPLQNIYYLKNCRFSPILSDCNDLRCSKWITMKAK